MRSLEQIEIILREECTGRLLPVYVTVYDHALAHKWLAALEHLIRHQYHLEKNYCFFGFVESSRTAQYLCDQINRSIAAINAAGLGYEIECEPYSPANTIQPDLDVDHDRMNWLHRYFEDLQGTSGHMSPYYMAADPVTRWHIRQLNLLCHEYESLVLSMRKQIQAPEWQRPSQLMCWLNAPRFTLEESDYELFGIHTINRDLGGCYLGVNKAVGKHHWEVFNDEGRDSRLDELVSTSLRSQTEAAGDFDIEWANNPGEYHWQKIKLREFCEWLTHNGFDPQDPGLTIGHPKIAQIDLVRTFGTEDYRSIWNQLAQHLDVYSIRLGSAQAIYDYHWSDADFMQRQVDIIQKGK